MFLPRTCLTTTMLKAKTLQLSAGTFASSPFSREYGSHTLSLYKARKSNPSDHSLQRFRLAQTPCSDDTERKSKLTDKRQS